MSSAADLPVAPGWQRTPEARFANLPGWNFAPRYTVCGGARVHYIDEGPPGGSLANVTALCLHGNPSWSYLYRHMIPAFTAAGVRVVAPDLIGFGRSDKPADEAAHSFDLHRGMLLEFIERLDLKNVMLVCQDWGGIFGLTLPMANRAAKAPSASVPREGAPALGRPDGRPERFTRLLVMNTAIATGTLSPGFVQWRDYSNSQPDLAVGKLLKRGKREMSDAEAAAYDAPFPDPSYKAALRAFPNLVPDGADAPGAAIGREALRFWRERWRGDSFMAIGMLDPVLGPAVMQPLQKAIRGCPPPMEVADGGHFLPEWGAPIAAAALAHFQLS